MMIKENEMIKNVKVIKEHEMMIKECKMIKEYKLLIKNGKMIRDCETMIKEGKMTLEHEVNKKRDTCIIKECEKIIECEMADIEDLKCLIWTSTLCLYIPKA